MENFLLKNLEFYKKNLSIKNEKLTNVNLINQLENFSNIVLKSKIVLNIDEIIEKIPNNHILQMLEKWEKNQ